VSIPQLALFEQFVASLDHARTVSPFFKAKHPEFGHGSIVSKKDFFLDVDKQFDILHKEQMQSAEKALMKDEFESLRDVTPDPSALAELVAQHASYVSDAIIKEMTFSYLPIHTLFRQLAHNDYEQSAPQLINSCERYVQTRMLLKQHLISADTAKTQ
jgi:hypothetical protein